MTRCRLHLAVGVAAMVLSEHAALAAGARLERVLLLPVTDRSSVVFELTAEPRQVSTRRLSDSVFEVDAGPGIDGTVAQTLKAPASMRFVESVTVRVVPTDAGPFIRARIRLTTAAQAVARSAGRRVYVDVSPAPAFRTVPAMPGQAARGNTVPGTSAASPAHQAPEDAYRTAVGPLVNRLQELGPFLTSAAGGDLSVAAAVLPALTSVRGSLAALQPPGPARGSHTMVLAAVDRIIKALAPDFTADRATIVRQSVTTIEVVGSAIGELAN